ncbi:hypothetical protein FRC03_012172 [Tulasnella sp. 419]|nr:hypothetical protein FRC03_012172 [Tulasnella sp. 419]
MCPTTQINIGAAAACAEPVASRMGNALVFVNMKEQRVCMTKTRHLPYTSCTGLAYTSRRLILQSPPLLFVQDLLSLPAQPKQNRLVKPSDKRWEDALTEKSIAHNEKINQ